MPSAAFSWVPVLILEWSPGMPPIAPNPAPACDVLHIRPGKHGSGWLADIPGIRWFTRRARKAVGIAAHDKAQQGGHPHAIFVVAGLVPDMADLAAAPYTTAFLAMVSRK